jgi:surface antigen
MTAVLRMAFDGPLREPAPDRLVRAIREGPPAGQSARRWSPRALSAAVAAGLLLVAIGASSGFLGATWVLRSQAELAAAARADAFAAMTTALNQALERQANGMPVDWQSSDGALIAQFTPTATFIDTQGRLCRRFAQATMQDGEAVQLQGIACRSGPADWHVDYRIIAGDAGGQLM